MRETLVLKRDVEIECWIIQGEIAFAKKRPELLPLLLAVKELGSATANDIAKHLLFAESGRRKVAQRWLSIAENYGLIISSNEPANRLRFRNSHAYSEDAFVLTEAGEQVIKTEKVFVPQEGCWKIWYCSDPLLPFPILKVESVKEEDTEEMEIERISFTLKTYFDSKISGSAIFDKKEIKCESVKSNGQKIKVNGNVQLSWNVAQQELKVIWEQSSLNVSAPVLNENDLWLELINQFSFGDKTTESFEPWDQKEEKLWFPYDRCSLEEIMKMETKIKFPAFSNRLFGKFEGPEVRKIPIKPLYNEAQLWFNDRLTESISDFCTEKNYREFIARANAGLENYSFEIPTRKNLSQKKWYDNSSKTRWYLMAVEDWNL